MKRKRIISVLATVAVAAGIFFFGPRGPADPVYQGKHLSKWLGEASYSNGDQTRTNAENAIKAIGTNALPYLMSEFTRPISKWRAAFEDWAEAHSNYQWNFKSDRSRVSRAVYGLYLLGPDNASALPALAGYLDDPEHSRDAMWAMSGAGEMALPYFLEAAVSTNSLAVDRGTGGLELLAKKSEKAVASLVQLLNHPDREVRRQSTYSLAATGQRPDLTIPLLVSRLEDTNNHFRVVDAQYLGRIGKSARPAIPALLPLLTNSDFHLAEAASNAVLRIDPTALPPPAP